LRIVYHSGRPQPSLTKVLEEGTLLRMSEVAKSELVGHLPARIGMLSGPNIAREVVTGHPGATVVGAPDADLAEGVQSPHGHAVQLFIGRPGSRELAGITTPSTSRVVAGR
jgi:glycerol-3-phosphate dehydrogenase